LHEIEPISEAELELQNSTDDFDDEKSKSDHRFVPPMPPEPPPRDVTVGGVSLNPPLDTTETSSSTSGKDADSNDLEPFKDKKGTL
jgi:hypothetical protein